MSEELKRRAGLTARPDLWAWVRRWGPLLLWMGVIFMVSHQPKGGIPGFGVWDLVVKKGAHFVAYAVLYWLAARPLGMGWRPLLLVAIYAISDELHQRFVPGRDGNGVDVVIDVLGGVTMWLVLRWWKE